MKGLEEKERELYNLYYLGDNQPFARYPATGYVMDTAHYIEAVVHKGSRILEIGCGHGRIMRYLAEKGFDVTGMDITLAGLPGYKTGEVDPMFHEAPVWGMPFKDDQFDFTFSTDVLEHLPRGTVEQSIQEIYRVTKEETFHCVSTGDDPNYPEAHKTVKPIAWWVKKFTRLNNKGLNVHVMDVPNYMKLLAREGIR